MLLIQRAVQLDLLRPGAWTPESFSPASFERLPTRRMAVVPSSQVGDERHERHERHERDVIVPRRR